MSSQEEIFPGMPPIEPKSSRTRNDSPLGENEQKLVIYFDKHPGEEFSLEELSNASGCTPEQVEASLKVLEKRGIELPTMYEHTAVPEAFEDDINKRVSKKRTQVIDIERFFGPRLLFGATADTHIASPHYIGNSAKKTGPLWDYYKMCQDMGITTVFHGGNWLDGHARFNRFEAKTIGATSQLEMFLNEYPRIDGMKTVFIAGDDHEGWWWQREGLDIADYAAAKAISGGRLDMEFVGYLEADIAIVPGQGFLYKKYEPNPKLIQQIQQMVERERKKKSNIPYPGTPQIDLKKLKNYALMKLRHGGGGTAYAKSLRPQRIVGIYHSAEKPQIELIGHYHKATYDYIRNTHVFQLGTTEDQSGFMRKLTIPAEMGSWIIGIHQDDFGAINRVMHRFVPYIGGVPRFRLRDFTSHDGQ